MTNHKATQDQWDHAGLHPADNRACFLELRDRTEVLEADAISAKACILEIYDKLDRLKVQHESNWSRIVKLEEAAANHFPDATKMVPAPAIAWARQLPVHDSCHPNGCDICQRDWPCARLVAEQDARKMVPAPAGGLVERVAEAIATSGEVIDEARDAILAVAEWLHELQVGGGVAAARWLQVGGGVAAARRLREEVERG
jgi:hypothetical protein